MVDNSKINLEDTMKLILGSYNTEPIEQEIWARDNKNSPNANEPQEVDSLGKTVCPMATAGCSNLC